MKSTFTLIVMVKIITNPNKYVKKGGKIIYSDLVDNLREKS